MSKLYVIPTPIGNLEDITLRALRILKEVSFILAEDTRTTSFLLKHYEIGTRLVSHHKFNEHATVERIVNQILAGEQVALVSDAGTPAISDPGYLVVKHCIDAGIEVECLPGATAFVPAIVASGLPNDRFCFEGFLPHKKGRQTRLMQLAQETRTMILYESPFRLIKTLEQLGQHLGDSRKCCVSREISKLHEENVRGTIAEVLQYFSNKSVKGEIVITVEGLNTKEKENQNN